LDNQKNMAKRQREEDDLINGDPFMIFVKQRVDDTISKDTCLKDEEIDFKMKKLTRRGAGHTCVWCEGANFTDETLLSQLSTLKTTCDKMLKDGINPGYAYNTLHDMYKKQIFVPVRIQEEIRASQGNPVPWTPVQLWTVESIANHYENHEIQSLQGIKQLIRATKALRNEWQEKGPNDNGAKTVDEPYINIALKLIKEESDLYKILNNFENSRKDKN